MIKTVSLKTAEALKESGWKKETYFADYLQKAETVNWMKEHVRGLRRDDFIYLPTTDELLEELPCDINGLGLLVCKIDAGNDGIYYVSYENCITRFSLTTNVLKNESLPEALAAMWLYLVKEGLIKPAPEGKE